MNRINVMIVEDQILVAKLLKSYLESSGNYSVSSIKANGKEALDSFRTENTDVILMDVEMPVLNGVSAAESIIKLDPDMKILMLSCNLNPDTIKRSLSVGASGYISKDCCGEDIITAISTVVKGGCYLCHDSIKALSSPVAKQAVKNGLEEKLTNRENEVLNLISRGYSNHDIAEKLFLSVRTVETHRRNILQKFGEKNFLGLIYSVMELKHGDEAVYQNHFKAV